MNAEISYVERFGKSEQRTYQLAFWNSIKKRWIVVYESPEVHEDFDAALKDAKFNLEMLLQKHEGDLMKLEGKEHL